MLVGFATVRAGLILALYDAPAAWLATRPVPAWVYTYLAVTFIGLGVSLVVANLRDARAAWLGGIFTLIGSPFATALVDNSHAGSVWLILSHARPEPFIGLFLWHFLTVFPTHVEARRARIMRRLAAASGGVGLWCAAAMLASVWRPVAAASFLRLPGRTDLYWLIVLAIPVPALAVLVLRSRAAQGAAERRARLFAFGLVAGIAPFTLEVLVENVWPAYKAFAHSAPVQPWIGAIIFGALAIVPFATAYSVLFDRVVEVRLALRAAMQYGLARYTIILVTLVPFAALATFLLEHRQESLVSLLASGPRPLLLIGSVALGLLALRLRSRWLDALDRRYFREPYDARNILTRFMGELAATNAAEIGERLAHEINEAFHADAGVFLTDETHEMMEHVGGSLPPVRLPAMLADLALANPQPMDVDLLSPASMFLRLPHAEQEWLARGQFSLIVSLRHANGTAAGLLALAPKRSGLPYSAEDRRLLAAIVSAAGLALEGMRSRDADTPVEPAARECRECTRLSRYDAARCACGGSLRVAAVPHTLRGVFRLEQRIGVGGTSVVYRAVDLNLSRDVAIKALPRVTPDAVTRLKHEARAMAALTHPNLAVVYSVETWHDTVFLVQEYLAGGMLSHRLGTSRPPLREVLDLGITLAGLLEYLHSSGVVHCDIKPNNIGFTQYGVVKLVDFGIARVLRDARVATDSPTTFGQQDADSAMMLEPSVRLVGTPEFMSPEAARGDRPAASFDLWALSVVLFEAASGRRPFEGGDFFAVLDRVLNGTATPIGDVRPDIPPPFVAFFDGALARDPARRPPNAAALKAALSRIREEVG